MDPEDGDSKFIKTFSTIDSSVMLWLDTSLIMLLLQEIVYICYFIW